MTFSVSSLFGSTATYGTTATGGAPTMPAYGTTMQADSLGLSGAATAPMPALNAVGSVVDNPTAAKRFGWLFINNTERLLKVGGDGGSFGRAFLSFVAGSVPFLTPAPRRQEIASQVMTWVSRADLLRTGMSPWDARLLQGAGVMTVADLRRMVNPMDQAVLAQRMQVIAASWGAQMTTSPAQLAGWVGAAQALPDRVK